VECIVVGIDFGDPSRTEPAKSEQWIKIKKFSTCAISAGLKLFVASFLVFDFPNLQLENWAHPETIAEILLVLMVTIITFLVWWGNFSARVCENFQDPKKPRGPTSRTKILATVLTTSEVNDALHNGLEDMLRANCSPRNMALALGCGIRDKRVPLMYATGRRLKESPEMRCHGARDIISNLSDRRRRICIDGVPAALDCGDVAKMLQTIDTSLEAADLEHCIVALQPLELTSDRGLAAQRRVYYDGPLTQGLLNFIKGETNAKPDPLSGAISFSNQLYFRQEAPREL
jgi:hypothetical protein